MPTNFLLPFAHHRKLQLNKASVECQWESDLFVRTWIFPYRPLQKVLSGYKAVYTDSPTFAQKTNTPRANDVDYVQ